MGDLWPKHAQDGVEPADSLVVGWVGLGGGGVIIVIIIVAIIVAIIVTTTTTININIVIIWS